MRRKQVYIDDDLDVALKRLAAATGLPEAVHIRAALRTYVESHPVSPPAADPLVELVGLVDDLDGPDDVAENHDRYLSGSI